MAVGLSSSKQAEAKQVFASARFWRVDFTAAAAAAAAAVAAAADNSSVS